MAFRFGRSPTKVLNGQSIDRSFGPGPFTRIGQTFFKPIVSMQKNFFGVTGVAPYRIISSFQTFNFIQSLVGIKIFGFKIVGFKIFHILDIVQNLQNIFPGLL